VLLLPEGKDGSLSAREDIQAHKCSALTKEDDA